jgi:hypothetical protein
MSAPCREGVRSPNETSLLLLGLIANKIARRINGFGRVGGGRGTGVEPSPRSAAYSNCANNLRDACTAGRELLVAQEGASSEMVKLRRTQYEQMFSALPSNSDIAQCSRHVSKVPIAVIDSLAENERGRQLRRTR